MNLLNSKTGCPFYFHAYSETFRHLKNQILLNANFLVKNYRGESILFHLIDLYLVAPEKTTPEKDYVKFLLEEFSQVLEKEPMLLAERDGVIEFIYITQVVNDKNQNNMSRYN